MKRLNRYDWTGLFGGIPCDKTLTVDKGVREMFLKTKLNSKKK